jgi:hypothetical protein
MEDVQYVLLDLPDDVASLLSPGERLVIEVRAAELKRFRRVL